MLYFNGTRVNRIIYNGQTVNRAFFNGAQFYTSEESFVPVWTLSGDGWVNTTWGAWSVGRDEGNLLTGIAEAVIRTNGHSKLRITPTGFGFRTGRSRGAIRIRINGTEVFSMGASASRTTPLDIDLTPYGETVTVRVELSADWGYTDMYCSNQLTLHD